MPPLHIQQVRWPPSIRGFPLRFLERVGRIGWRLSYIDAKGDAEPSFLEQPEEGRHSTCYRAPDRDPVLDVHRCPMRMILSHIAPPGFHGPSVRLARLLVPRNANGATERGCKPAVAPRP